MQALRMALVTVWCDASSFCVDMELPTFMPIEQLATQLLEALKIMAPERFLTVEHLELNCGGNTLFAQSTLASSGMWDGAVLELKIGGTV